MIHTGLRDLLNQRCNQALTLAVAPSPSAMQTRTSGDIAIRYHSVRPTTRQEAGCPDPASTAPE